MVKLTDENWEYLTNFGRAKQIMWNSDQNLCLSSIFIFTVAGFFSQGTAILAWNFLNIIAIICYLTINYQKAKTVNLAQDRWEQDERACAFGLSEKRRGKTNALR